MPKIEEYYCPECDIIIEVFRKDQVVKCPNCGAGIKKLFSAFGIGGCSPKTNQRSKQEEAENKAYEADVKEYQAEEAEIKKGDEHWHHEFAHVLNVRTPARRKYLESDARVEQMRQINNG